MISDVLFEAVEEIDRYLADEDEAGLDYWGMYDEIKVLRDSMHAMRRKLDGAPDPESAVEASE